MTCSCVRRTVRLCNIADAGIDRRRLHGRKFVDLGSGGGFAEHERPAAEVIEILGFVPRAEQPTEKVHKTSLLTGLYT